MFCELWSSLLTVYRLAAFTGRLRNYSRTFSEPPRQVILGGRVLIMGYPKKSDFGEGGSNNAAVAAAVVIAVQ